MRIIKKQPVDDTKLQFGKQPVKPTAKKTTVTKKTKKTAKPPKFYANKAALSLIKK